jgi:methyltransferase (TIGR00027 family)
LPESPSLTAEMVCLVRAREAQRAEGDRLIDDPFAGRFLELSGSRLVRGGVTGPIARAWAAGFKLPFVGFAALVLARHRIMDDLLQAETAAGATQAVILGAGYDARAYRFPPPRGPARYFEVDHPTLSSRKRELVARALGTAAPPPHVTFVTVDFMRERLDERLVAEGFDRSARTVFIWEGVTYYLTPDAVRRTLETVRDLGGPGSSVVFDAWARPPGRVQGALIEATRLAVRVIGNAIAEPFHFFLDSREGASALLRETGFECLFNHGSDDLRALLRKSGRPLLFVPPHLVVAAGRKT